MNPTLLIGLLATAQVVAGRPAVVVTTDCGVEVDDQWALAHLALSPAFDLKGIVTTHAPSLKPPAAETSAHAARDILDRLALRVTPPVLAGSSVALADRARPMANPGVDFLLEQARGRSSENRLVILVLGAATDVASALLTDPTFADRVTIVAMGFNAWPDGGDVWNVKNDVKAWQILLESGAPIVVGDAAVTRRHLAMTRAKARDLLGGRGPAGSYLADLLVRWLDAHPKLAESSAGDKDRWPIWDEVTVAHLLGLTRSQAHPRPRLRDDMTFDHAHPRGSIAWITEIDSDRLWDDLATKLDRTRAKP